MVPLKELIHCVNQTVTVQGFISAVTLIATETYGTYVNFKISDSARTQVDIARRYKAEDIVSSQQFKEMLAELVTTGAEIQLTNVIVEQKKPLSNGCKLSMKSGSTLHHLGFANPSRAVNQKPKKIFIAEIEGYPADTSRVFTTDAFVVGIQQNMDMSVLYVFLADSTEAQVTLTLFGQQRNHVLPLLPRWRPIVRIKAFLIKSFAGRTLHLCDVEDVIQLVPTEPLEDPYGDICMKYFSDLTEWEIRMRDCPPEERTPSPVNKMQEDNAFQFIRKERVYMGPRQYIRTLSGALPSVFNRIETVTDLLRAMNSADANLTVVIGEVRARLSRIVPNSECHRSGIDNVWNSYGYPGCAFPSQANPSFLCNSRVTLEPKSNLWVCSRHGEHRSPTFQFVFKSSIDLQDRTGTIRISAVGDTFRKMLGVAAKDPVTTTRYSRLDELDSVGKKLAVIAESIRFNEYLLRLHGSAGNGMFVLRLLDFVPLGHIFDLLMEEGQTNRYFHLKEDQAYGDRGWFDIADQGLVQPEGAVWDPILQRYTDGYRILDLREEEEELNDWH